MTKKIALIDDEEDIRLAVRAVLESGDYTVVEASNGKKGLELLRKQKTDLLIVDFFMPLMNGRQVIEEIRKDKLLKDLKVVLLTVATFGSEGKKKLKELNVAAYIQKPFDNAELLSTIKKLLK